MASGLVAKKIALFEPKKRSSENVVCRLKRKHAIRRKRFSRDRRLTSEPQLFSSDSDENLHLDNPNLFHQTSSAQVASSLSASCSALLDLIYNSRNQEKYPTAYDIEEPQTILQSLPMISIKDKKILCRTSSLEEAFPARLNIIDIDIEIRVEKKQSSRPSSPVNDVDSDPVLDAYEPMQPMIIPSCIDKIKLIAKLDKSNFSKGNNSPSNCFNSSSPSENYNNSSSSTLSSSNSNSSNYFCTSCGTYNPHSDTTQEHIYENFALVPPPRPPKSKPSNFMSSSSSSLLPLPLPLRSKASRSPIEFCKIPTSFGDSYNQHVVKTTIVDDKDNNVRNRSVILGTSSSGCDIIQIMPDYNNKTESTISQNINPETVSEEKDPFYEDLYDYCLPPDLCEEFDFIQPASVTSFVQHDKDDDVEYCDCSTVMAMAINNLNSGGTVIYTPSSNSGSGCGTESSASPPMNSAETNYTSEQMGNENEERNNATTHTFGNDDMKGFFYLGTLLREELTEPNLAVETKVVKDGSSGGFSVSTIHNSPIPPLNGDDGNHLSNNGPDGIYDKKYSSGVVNLLPNDSKDKKGKERVSCNLSWV